MAEAEESGIDVVLKSISCTGLSICVLSRRISDILRSGSLLDKSKVQYSKHKDFSIFVAKLDDDSSKIETMDIEACDISQVRFTRQTGLRVLNRVACRAMCFLKFDNLKQYFHLDHLDDHSSAYLKEISASLDFHVTFSHAYLSFVNFMSYNRPVQTYFATYDFVDCSIFRPYWRSRLTSLLTPFTLGGVKTSRCFYFGSGPTSAFTKLLEWCSTDAMRTPTTVQRLICAFCVVGISSFLPGLENQLHSANRPVRFSWYGDPLDDASALDDEE